MRYPRGNPKQNMQLRCSQEPPPPPQTKVQNKDKHAHPPAFPVSGYDRYGNVSKIVSHDKASGKHRYPCQGGTHLLRILQTNPKKKQKRETETGDGKRPLVLSSNFLSFTTRTCSYSIPGTTRNTNKIKNSTIKSPSYIRAVHIEL